MIIQTPILNQIRNNNPLITFEPRGSYAVSSQSHKIHMANTRNHFNFMSKTRITRS
ncbi:hypothetical protein HanRHA438_Chr10g0437391 [Helianthus annuus]|nr:hypothetical protein HanRHA438_Chr10g0437391 [Helianthus annuus]